MKKSTYNVTCKIDGKITLKEVSGFVFTKEFKGKTYKFGVTSNDVGCGISELSTGFYVADCEKRKDAETVVQNILDKCDNFDVIVSSAIKKYGEINISEENKKLL